MSVRSAIRIDAPKFDLRFERGRGQIRLGRPLSSSLASFDALAMELDVRGRLSLRGGAARFRHHRSRLRTASLVVRPSVLIRLAREQGVSLAIDRASEDLAVSIRDAIGTIAFRGIVAFDGPDLLIFPRGLAFVRRGPVSPWSRLRAAARELGFEWAADVGAFRWRRPLRSLLADALLPHGWRVPEERGLSVRTDGSRVWAEHGPAATPSAEACAEGNELALRLEDDHPWIDHEAYAIGPWGDFERALDDEDVDASRALLRAGSSAWLYAEAVLTWVDVFGDLVEDHELGERLLDALSRIPEEGASWTDAVELLATRGQIAALRLANAALGGPLPRARRATLAAIAIEGILDHADPSELALADGLANDLMAEAELLSPELPRVIAARAALEHRAGRSEAAVRAWTRAADATTSPRRAARWRRRAAELVLGMHGPAAAEPLLRQALMELERSGSDEPTLVAQLASVVAERGERRESSELFARLLRDADPSDDAWRAAVLAAARFHVEAGEHDRARPFLAALGNEEEANDVALSESVVLQGDLLEDVVIDDSAEHELDEVFDADPFDPSESLDAVSVVHIEEPPPVTLVSVADDEVRALLKEARELDDPTGLLEGALEGALEEADPDGVRRVLAVLDRLAGFDSEAKLRERAHRLLRRLGEEP